MELSPYLLHSVQAGLLVQNKYNFQKQGYESHNLFFNLICRTRMILLMWKKKGGGGGINYFFQTCLACSTLSTAWLRAGCERQGNTSWAVLCSGSLPQQPLLKAVRCFHPAGAHRWQQDRGHTPPSTCKGLSPTAAPSAHNPRSALTISSPICKVLEILSAAWCVAGSALPHKITFYSKVFLLKATEEGKSLSWSQGHIWCFCSVKPHFFCHKLISWSADSQGHFNFSSEISLEGAKLFCSLENIKWLRLPQAMK